MRHRLLKIVSALLCIALSASLFAKTNIKENAQTHFIVLTDIHFDPFTTCYKSHERPCAIIKKLQRAPVKEWPAIFAAADTQVPVYREDTNYPLLISSLTAAKEAAATAKARFVLILGDFLSHDNRHYYKQYAQDKTRAGYQAFVNKTLQFLTEELDRTFPSLDVYTLPGNNDSDRSDYYVAPHGPFLQTLATHWSGLIKNNDNRTAMRQEFPAGGYYAVDILPQKNMRLIMLNSVLFSTKAKGNHLKQAANDELDWLHAELIQAKKNNQRVLIGMHIPEGIDVYSSIHIHLFRLIEFWQTEFSQRFEAELKQFSADITGIFVGHLHADWFQVQRFDDFHEIPILGTPSISPIFGNNPGFKIYSYSAQSRQIDDFITYYYPMSEGKWKVEYHFSQVYPSHRNPCSVVARMNALQPVGRLANIYKLFYSVNTTSQPITTQWLPYWCNVHKMDNDQYRQCIHSYGLRKSGIV